jgi:diguanylate cyclase (GGDEF)-like protein/PAS domain S-box-containing protein
MEHVLPNILDMRTVLIGFALSSLLCAGVMAALWRQNRDRFHGTGFWLVHYVLLLLGSSFMALRGFIPDGLSIGLGSPLIIAGALAMLVGVERFVGRSGLRIPNYLLLAAFVALHEYFAFDHANLNARNHLLSVAFLLLNLQCALAMFRGHDQGMRRAAFWPGAVFAALCLVCLLRIGVDLAYPVNNDFMRSNSYSTLSVISVQMLQVALALSLVLMLNNRLVAELADEIAMRGRTEAELRLSEEKFYKAFNASPDMVALVRLNDGRFVEVNDGFSAQLGYTRQQALGASALEMGLWAEPRDRERLLAGLRENGRVRDWEVDLRTRSGIVLNCLGTSNVIDVGGEAHVLAIVRNITERKLADRIVRTRLRLWEYAADHSVRELMRKALDEVEDMTGSRIGFFHSIDAERNRVDPQVWSARTNATACSVERVGHLPLERAGVWADCVRQGEPVVHNDYAALARPGGLPPGHVPVLRELTVPVLREGRPVAVLGVGNKPADYTDLDVGHAVFIADIAWSIVEQKRSYEDIVRLNAQLRSQAMTDELTGLRNRRAFFLHGEEEVRRARRYQAPLALLMLDLDRFKQVNDTCGHDAGDRVLAGVAAALRQNMREIDIIGRLGGEEFCILLPNTPGQAAAGLAERLRRSVAELEFPFSGAALRVTVSIGVSELGPGRETLEAMLREADAAMYRAKSQGRDRVLGAPTPGGPV